jgi:Tfp pilus assembly protein PilN
MLRRTQWLVGLIFLICFLGHCALPQTRDRDPLNEKEIDQMRESADFPDKRLELMINFARARMASIDQLRADAKNAKDRPMQIHDLLQDFSSLLDEIDDNVDMYASHKTDMRRGLKLLIEADSEWALNLRGLKDQSPPEELEQYSFVLANARDAVSDSADGARQELQEQNELAKEKKLNKIYTQRPD